MSIYADPFALSVRYHTVQRRLRLQQEIAEAPHKIEGVLELHLSNEVIREVYIDEIGLPDPRPPPAPPAGDFTFAEFNRCRWEQAGISPPSSEVEEVFDLCPASTYSPTSGSRVWLIRDTTCKLTSTLINTPLEKLNDQNYRSWKYNTKMMLIEGELWKCVTEPAPDEEASRTIFNMKQEKALAMIALTISPSQQIHIMDCTTAREACDTLEQVYEPKSRSRILQLKKQFISIRFEEQETMTNYLGRLEDLFGSLKRGRRRNARSRPRLFNACWPTGVIRRNHHDLQQRRRQGIHL
ncbi:hypothetical protein LAZ67_6004026 [Cordylochernes scorpioides]|uniref:DUF4219 domain-containing protein n=1 Tax=Cordylochernes scorpioides TaxID=51811 RepID=A0ABY6KR50_9ARAC|nr:hypothetical protein LAZ67_6004026 [Cordylochernes scorpioides]